MTIVPRIRLISIAAASLGLAASVAPVQAAPGATSRAGAAVQGQNQSADPARKICVRMDMPNSRLPRRVCRTPAEWERAGGLPTND